MKPKVIIIGGPTASGKTSLSVELAKRLNGEIISADSMQIYKKLDVGTAKVTEEEMQGIPHHLIDITEPNHEFSVAEFQNLAYQKIEEILAKGKQPIIVGGTGLYISSLVNNMKFVEYSEKEEEIKEKLKVRIEDLGENAKNVLYAELEEIDKDAAVKIPKNNFKRVVRALEMYYITGKTKTQQEKLTIPEEGKYEYHTFIIDWPRNILYDRIEQRIDIMMNQNILEEAKWILSLNLDNKCTAMQAIGYKEFFPYLKGEATLEECVEVLKLNTRHYAKRQLTWFKRINNVKYIDANIKIEEKIEYIIKNI